MVVHGQNKFYSPGLSDTYFVIFAYIGWGIMSIHHYGQYCNMVTLSITTKTTFNFWFMAKELIMSILTHAIISHLIN